MPKSAIEELKPLEKEPVQAYFSNRFQISDIVEWVSDQIGPAQLFISTFSTGEEFIRRLWKMKQKGKISHCELFCDMRAARKTMILSGFMREVFDEVRLCENHSKVALLSNNRHSVAIVTSQNQTRGDRYEAGIITMNNFTIAQLRAGFYNLLKHSVGICSLTNK